MASDVLEQLVTEFVFKVNELGLNKYLNAQKKINKNTKDMIKLNSTLTRGFAKFFGVLGLGFGFKSLIDTYRNLDLARRSIEGLTGSTQDFEFLTQEAYRTATSIDVVAQSYKGFYAAANMSKFNKSQIQDMYADLLTGLRGAGSTPERVKGALLSIEQMFSKGTIQAQELRLQLGNALPGAFELMASAAGVTTKELDTMMRKGLLPATKYVPLLIKEIKDYYSSGFIKNVKSLDAAMINLGNAWKFFQDEIMRGEAGKGIVELITTLTDFLRSPQSIAIAKTLGEAIGLMAKALGFVAKHIKLILFLFGINALSRLPMVFGNIKKSIIGLSEDIAWGSKSLNYGLNNVVFTIANLIQGCGGLVPILKAIGASVGLLMKNLLPIIAIGAVIGAIALALEDIFMYLRNPEALTLTRELVSKSPKLYEALENFRKSAEDFKEVWINQLQPQLERFLDSLMDWVGSDHKILGSFFEWLLTKIGEVLGGLGDILEAMQRIDKANPLSGRNERIRGARERVNRGVANLINDPLPMRIARNMAYNTFHPTEMTNLLTPLPINYDLAKTENNTQNNTYNINVTGGANSTPMDIANAVMKKLNGELDTTQGLYTPYLRN